MTECCAEYVFFRALLSFFGALLKTGILILSHLSEDESMMTSYVWDSDIVVSNSARNEHVSQSETIRINWREIFGITANILYLRTLIFFGCIITHRNTYYWREMVGRTAKLCTFFFWGCVVTLTHTHLHQQRHAHKHLERRLTSFISILLVWSRIQTQT